MVVKRRVVLHFPRVLLDKPIMSRLVKDYDVEFSILRASVTPRERGLLVLELSADEQGYDKAIAFLTDLGVDIQLLEQDIVRHEEKCIHCGACTSVCPAGALSLDRETMEVIFQPSLCVACEHCIPACPTNAMEVHFDDD
jgi:ferredoxin